MSNLLESLENIAKEVAQREGFRLYDIEFIQGQRKLVVTIDKADGGVSIDDCVTVSRGINLLLDVEDLIPGEAYDLEVSSPGLERELKKDWHFKEAIGEKVKVSIKADAPTESWGGLRAFTGQIQEVSEEGLLTFIELENSKLDSVQVPMQFLHKAQVVFDYGRSFGAKKNFKNKKTKK